MKSINVKKIATVAAGAILLGTAFAGAALTEAQQTALGNVVPTWYSNGEPNVQVVVGTNAAVSDAMVAGNIAAVLANKAYTTGPTVPGTGSAVPAAPVTVSVSRPAAAVGADEYLMKTGLTDHLDNNGIGVGASQLNLSTTKSSQTGGLPNTWYTVSSGNWRNGLTTHTVTVQGSTAQPSSEEREQIYCFASTVYNDNADRYRADQMDCVYSATFSSALPLNADTSYDYNSGSSSSTDHIDATRTPTTIYFLGEPWVVTSVATTTNPTSLTIGKSYMVRQTVSQGQEISVPGTEYKVKLEQVNGPTGSTSQPSCTVKVTNANGSSVLRTGLAQNSAADKISELGNFFVKISSVGYSSAAGAVNTCEVSAYSDSLTIKNDTIGTAYGNWKGMLLGANRSSSTALSEMRVYNDNLQYAGSGSSSASPGEKLTIISGLSSGSGYEFEFKGSDLTDSDTDTLKVANYQLSGLFPNSGSTAVYDGLSFCSEKSDAFQFTGSTDTSKCIYLPLKMKVNDTSNSNLANTTGKSPLLHAWYMNSSNGWVNASNSADTNWYITADPAAPSAQGVNFSIALPAYYYGASGASDNKVRFNVTLSLGGAINSSIIGAREPNSTTWNVTNAMILVPEVLNDSSSTANGWWTLYYVYPNQYDTVGNFRNTINATVSDSLNYTAPLFGALSYTGNVPYCSTRGSCIESGGFGTGTVTIKYAKRLGQAAYVLRKRAGVSAAGTPTVVCTPGAACDLGGGYMVTLPDTVAAGSGGSSTQVVQLNTAVAPLVVLDSAADNAQPQIVVGGHVVNAIAAQMDARSGLTATNKVVVEVEGNKVLVAGWDAADTQAAGRELIQFLASWNPE